MTNQLLLSNNRTMLRKDQNLCFVNSTLQVLYRIQDVRELFQAVDPPAFPDTWPMSKGLCKLFQFAGNYEVSAAELRRCVFISKFSDLFSKIH